MIYKLIMYSYYVGTKSRIKYVKLIKLNYNDYKTRYNSDFIISSSSNQSTYIYLFFLNRAHLLTNNLII